MWPIIIVLVLAGVLIYWLFWSGNRGKKTGERYVCDVCGEQHCTCRKVDQE